MTDAPRLLDVELPLESEALATHVARTLAAEAHASPPRTRVRVAREGATVRLRIEAEDTRSLRAGANSFLRWADTAIAVARAALASSESFKGSP